VEGSVEDIGLLGWELPLMDKYVIIGFIALHVLVRRRVPTVYFAHPHRNHIIHGSALLRRDPDFPLEFL
jgi:hypothetical protein